MTVQADVAAGTATLVIGGDLDVTTVPLLSQQLTALQQSRPRLIIIEAGRAQYVDCAAARQMASLARPGVPRPVLRAPSPALRRILELTGLAASFEMGHPAPPS